MDGPYFATLSHDKTRWIVASPHGGACTAPPRDGQLDQFDFISEARANIYADNYNREIAEWLAGREGVRIYQALEDRAQSWRAAAESYAKSQPDMALRMENNAKAIELLMHLHTEAGIDKIAEMIPGYTAMPLPELYSSDNPPPDEPGEQL